MFICFCNLQLATLITIYVFNQKITLFNSIFPFFFSFLYISSLNFNMFPLFLLQGIVRILKSLFSLENKIDQVPLSSQGPGKTPSNVLPGSWLCSILEEVGLLHTMVRTFLFLFYLFIFFPSFFLFFSFLLSPVLLFFSPYFCFFYKKKNIFLRIIIYT